MYSPGFWYLFVVLLVFLALLRNHCYSFHRTKLSRGRMLLKRGTGSGERGTGNGSLGTSCQRKPPQKSKMAVQKTRERKKKTKKGIRALVEIRWGLNCKSDSHFTFTF